MTKEELKALYKENILPESQEPFHFHKGVGEAIKAYNPICGDKYNLFVDEELCFDGFGCAISKASTSLLLRNAEGKSVVEVIELCKTFLSAFESNSYDKLPGELQLLIELKNFDGRVDCILLSWKAMLNHLMK